MDNLKAYQKKAIDKIARNKNYKMLAIIDNENHTRYFIVNGAFILELKNTDLIIYSDINNYFIYNNSRELNNPYIFDVVKTGLKLYENTIYSSNSTEYFIKNNEIKPVTVITDNFNHIVYRAENRFFNYKFIKLFTDISDHNIYSRFTYDFKSNFSPLVIENENAALTLLQVINPALTEYARNNPITEDGGENE